MKPVLFVERMRRRVIGVPMAGEPFIEANRHEATAEDLMMTRRACIYAAEIACKRGELDGDLSGLAAHFDGMGVVVFVEADTAQREVARVVISEDVMGFNPHRPALRLTDDREA